MGNPLSIKEAFQNMQGPGIEIMQGKVISASPLKIQMINDEKLIINERITIVPWHLTDYTTTATFIVDGGDLESVTVSGGSHSHSGGEHEGHESGDGSHSHSGGSHTHDLSSFSLKNGTLTVYNALKADDIVHVLSLNGGKLYYVLDRVVA